MIQIGWPPQISDMLTHHRIKRHRDGTKFEKSFKIENLQIFSFLRHEVPFKAKNNREAVVVCAIHVVKRPSKRSVLVLTNHRIVRHHDGKNSKKIFKIENKGKVVETALQYT